MKHKPILSSKSCLAHHSSPVHNFSFFEIWDWNFTHIYITVVFTLLHKFALLLYHSWNNCNYILLYHSFFEMPSVLSLSWSWCWLQSVSDIATLCPIWRLDVISFTASNPKMCLLQFHTTHVFYDDSPQLPNDITSNLEVGQCIGSWDLLFMTGTFQIDRVDTSTTQWHPLLSDSQCSIHNDQPPKSMNLMCVLPHYFKLNPLPGVLPSVSSADVGDYY